MRRFVLVPALVVGLLASVGLSATPAYAAAPTVPKSSVAKPFVRQNFVISGSVGTKFARPVQLQRLVKGRWTLDQSAKTAVNGSYRFTVSTTAASRDFRVVAVKTPHNVAVSSAAVTVKTQSDTVRLVLSRNRKTGLATGFPSLQTKGRLWALQVKSGGTWKQVGAKVTESGKRVHATFPLGSHTYRLIGNTLPGATSRPVSTNETISAGPSKFGHHVMFVMTNSGALPKKKGKDYTGTAAVDNGAPADLETVAVRGNSSATYAKKPYKLKYIDSQRPVGLPAGKNFILLPNYQDHSLIRTAVGIGAVASRLGGLRWSPHRAFTELFVNGKYLGSYEIIEAIKIESGSPKNAPRVAANEKTGVIIEINPAEHKGTPGIFKGAHGMWYGFKDPDEAKTKKDGSVDPEGVTPAKTKAMKARIKKFESVLYGSGYRSKTKGWQHYLDMNSAVDFYLENEFIKNWDGDFYRSTYFYTYDYANPNSKFRMGPIWDVDRSAASKTIGSQIVQSTSGWWMNGDGGGHTAASDNVHTKHWFVRIAKDPAFQKALRKRWDQKRYVFKAAGGTYVNRAVAELTKTAAANDRKLWQKSRPSGRYAPRASSFNGEISFLKKWYTARYKWMNSKLK